MKKYNLLFVFADQWRRTATGFSLKEDVITPNIDEFSKESLVFNNAVSTGPLCSPSRASMLTGTYPITHGVVTNCKLGLNDVYLKEDAITIMDVLKKNDYYVGYIGKWHLDNPELNYDENPKSGAKEWDAYTPHNKRHGVDYWYAYNAYDNHLKPHYWEKDHNMIQVDEWSVKHETDKAIEFLEKNKDKNFSLFLSWNPPHTPLDLVPQKYIDIYKDKEIRKFENVILEGVIDHTETMASPLNFTEESFDLALKKYYAAITGIDENFGRIIKYLKDNNLYDNTIIVLTADHGEMMASHGLWSKHVWYEESIGVPFLIKCNDRKGVTDTVLSGVDIMPTLLSLLDIEIPKTVEGRNLERTILKDEYIDNLAYITAIPGALTAIKQFKDEKLNFLNYGWRAVRDKDYTFVVNRGYKPYQKIEKILYNNKEDELQMKPENVLNSNNEIAKKLEKKLEEWLQKYNDKFKINN